MFGEGITLGSVLFYYVISRMAKWLNHVWCRSNWTPEGVMQKQAVQIFMNFVIINFVSILNFTIIYIQTNMKFYRWKRDIVRY